MWSFGQLLMTHTVNLSHLGKSELTISKVKPHNRTGELICRDSSKSRAHVGCDGNLSTEVNVYWSQCQPSVSVQERLPVVSLRTSQLDKVIAFYGSIQFSCKCDLPINNFCGLQVPSSLDSPNIMSTVFHQNFPQTYLRFLQFNTSSNKFGLLARPCCCHLWGYCSASPPKSEWPKRVSTRLMLLCFGTNTPRDRCTEGTVLSSKENKHACTWQFIEVGKFTTLFSFIVSGLLHWPIFYSFH